VRGLRNDSYEAGRGREGERLRGYPYRSSSRRGRSTSWDGGSSPTQPSPSQGFAASLCDPRYHIDIRPTVPKLSSHSSSRATGMQSQVWLLGRDAPSRVVNAGSTPLNRDGRQWVRASPFGFSAEVAPLMSFFEFLRPLLALGRKAPRCPAQGVGAPHLLQMGSRWSAWRRHARVSSFPIPVHVQRLG
jgi:hypothetical protein